jgi:TRAP-type C4-dicarboxylate transport system substrate-binding protein|tara:strand:- start:6 stop:194 length:189 start_codon:yes stop_codon:yes gene_type:complete
MLIFIIILLVIDLGKYSKLSDKISKILTNLSDSIEDSGFKKDANENELKHVQRFIDKKISKD